MSARRRRATLEPMYLMSARALRRRGLDPWFRRRPRSAAVVAASLFAGIVVARLAGVPPASSLADLGVFPVALAALAFGRTAGVASGVVGAALTSAPPAATGHTDSLLGWLLHALSIVVIGGLLGDASDRLAAAQRLRSEIFLSAQRHREAIEINDGLVQGMAATKWLLESGREAAALDALSETLENGEQLVSKLIRDAAIGSEGAHRSRSTKVGAELRGNPTAARAPGAGRSA